MKRLYTLTLMLSMGLFGLAQDWSETLAFEDLTPNGGEFFGNCVAIDGNFAVVGSTVDGDIGDGNDIPGRGSATIYKNDGNGNWVFLQKITTSDESDIAGFGTDIDLEGDVMVIGSKFGDCAYIFENDGSDNWVEIQKIFPSDQDEVLQDGFGESVSISGNTIVVGAYLNWTDANNENPLNGAGSAFIFEKDGDGTWNETQKITSTNRDEADFFGHSVSISGNYLISGAYYEQTDENDENPFYQSGAGYIFEKENGTWEMVQKIVASDRGPVTQYARDVHMDGSTAVVGSHLLGDDANGILAGTVYIYNRDNSGNWNEDQLINAPVTAHQDFFGHSVHKDGSRMVIGAFGQDFDAAGENEITNSGAAYLYDLDDSGEWVLTQKIVASDRGIYANFGWAVGISGSTCLIGSDASGYDPEDESNYNTGSAYIFSTDTPQNIQETEELSFDFYPNPGSELLNLTQDLNGKTVRIFTSVGQLTQTTRVLNNTLDISQLNAGMYILQIEGYKSMPLIKM